MTERSVTRSLLVGVGLMLASGCSPAGSPPEPPPATPEAAPATKGETAVQAEPEAADGREEIWMACYLQGSQIGHTHTVVQRRDQDGQALVEVAYDDELVMQRFQETTVVRTKLRTLETATGGLREFRSELQTGPEALITEGSFRDGQLWMTTVTQGTSQTQSIPWEEGWGGFFADQLSLRRQPMKPGETRRLKALLPATQLSGETRLEAVSYEATRLPDGTRQLLRIDVETDLGRAKFKSMLWTDEQGRCWKSRELQLGLEGYRTSRESALRPPDVRGFDLGESTVVRLAAPLADPRRTQRVAYRAVLTEGDAAGLFVSGLAQRVRKVDAKTAEITVVAVRPGDPPLPPEGEREPPPTAADREASPLIQSEDAQVVALAAGGAGDERDPWKLACALESHVRAKVRLKNYTTAMATAADVARSGEGDCTEHAVLLAALCRARGLPARVAIGLVYYPPSQGFAYHMWTEAWIEDRWIGLDATLGDGGIGADHLKFAVSSLEGTQAFAEMLPVVQALGRLQLTVLSTE